MLQTRSSILLVAQVNTQAGGSAVVITNSSNLFITNTNLTVIVQNSGGLFSQQSGAWTVAVSNTNPLVQIQNSAGWVVAVSNTNPLVSIVNSAGWVFAQSNTAGQSFILQGGSVNIVNSAGWVVSQANTAGMTVNVINSAGWSTFAVDSAAVGSVVSVVASTVGTVTLAASQTRRVALSIYNASVNPLFMKLGASASTASYTLMMVGSGYYELPRPIYNGIVTGIWQTANGNAYITETT